MSKSIISITPLGAGQEVGRSCIILKMYSRTIMLDSGIHPGNPGFSSLPYFDLIDLSSIDLLLISHFHIDHSAALPYLLSKPEFKAKIYMTSPTKSIYRLIIKDYLNVQSATSLYTQSDFNKSLNRIKTINYHQYITLNYRDEVDITFTCYNAGHVLGAAEFLITVNNTDVLYTGDFSLTPDRHLPAAEIPSKPPLITIMESTFGLSCHPPIESREKAFVEGIKNVLLRGGKCLIPVFALGRAQEIMLILEEYFDKNKNLQKFKIFFASNLAANSSPIFRAYSNSNNSNFDFKFINNLENTKNEKIIEIEKEPCVLLASPGMLQNGFSRDVLERWANNSRNGLFLTGYSVIGTLARTLQTEPDSFIGINGNKITRKIEIFNINFAAHADSDELRKFAKDVGSKYFVLVHGEKTEMERLKKTLENDLNKYSSSSYDNSSFLYNSEDSKRFNFNNKNKDFFDKQNFNEKYFFTPKNCQSVEIEIENENSIRIPIEYCNSNLEEGYLYGNIFYKKNDLKNKIKGFQLIQKILLRDIDLKNFSKLVSRIFDVKNIGDDRFLYGNCVSAYNENGNVILEWVNGYKSDSIAESITTLFLDKNLKNLIDKENKNELIYNENNEIAKIELLKNYCKEENEKCKNILKESFLFIDEKENKIFLSNDKNKWFEVEFDDLKGPIISNEFRDCKEFELINEICNVVKSLVRPIG